VVHDVVEPIVEDVLTPVLEDAVEPVVEEVKPLVPQAVAPIVQAVVWPVLVDVVEPIDDPAAEVADLADAGSQILPELPWAPAPGETTALEPDLSETIPAPSTPADPIPTAASDLDATLQAHPAQSPELDATLLAHPAQWPELDAAVLAHPEHWPVIPAAWSPKLDPPAGATGAKATSPARPFATTPTLPLLLAPLGSARARPASAPLRPAPVPGAPAPNEPPPPANTPPGTSLAGNGGSPIGGAPPPNLATCLSGDCRVIRHAAPRRPTGIVLPNLAPPG
jgi:hypothetical protein